MRLLSKFFGMMRELVVFTIQTRRKQVQSSVLSVNRRFQDTANGDVYILYTGASLADKDLRWLQGKEVIAANLAFLHECYRDIEIKHYSLVESWSYRNFTLLSFLLDLALSRRRHGTRPTVWLSTAARHYIDTPSLHNDFNTGELLAGVDLQFIRSNGDFVDDKVVRSDFGEVCNVAQGTMTFCIFLAIYLGYKKIYLLGSDYSKQPMLLGHFYDGVREEVSAEGMNKIAKFDICAQVDVRAQVMDDYAKSKGVEIINVVEKGFVSRVFTAVRYEAIAQGGGS